MNSYGEVCELLAESEITRHRLTCDQKFLSFRSVLQRLEQDVSFRQFFTEVLRASGFNAFRWETPGVTTSNVDSVFEFVLVSSPSLIRPADPDAFDEPMRKSDSNDGVACFDNLGRNARMIVPCPTGNDSHYTHLASFLRGAPEDQVDRLWHHVGREMRRCIGHQPRWLSTAGGGVAWLHVRIDQRPKYYRYRPYQSVR